MSEAAPRLVWFDFDDLPPRLLYGVMTLRQRVFVVEQNCAYADLDGLDDKARHLVALTGEDVRPAACLRLFGPNKTDIAPAARLGRIVVSPDCRKTGLGPALIREGLAEAARLYARAPVVISAQAALAGYYARFGFVAEGAIYDEDGIPHVTMRTGG
ncbi:MAG TPA: GNAT family N-acetyltransferase [Azospirillaceae bacterium]|nr:GNAT family N-acetyltransferase [Azospirillaceae bacterium]HRQ80029.1 GNAT family N-acetyltransferase [Azospirillaceae bacterium]